MSAAGFSTACASESARVAALAHAIQLPIIQAKRSEWLPPSFRELLQHRLGIANRMFICAWAGRLGFGDVTARRAD
jgi:hypothetical protein